jgi:hypothetical protein
MIDRASRQQFVDALVGNVYFTGFDPAAFILTKSGCWRRGSIPAEGKCRAQRADAAIGASPM